MYIRKGKVIVMIKVGQCQKITGNLQIFKNFIPKHHLKLLHPVHGNGIDKMSIVNFFDFTVLIYLQVVQIGF